MHLHFPFDSLSGRRLRLSFSLLELLVVFAIISVLAALLTPTMTGLKDIRNKTICMNNMRHIFMAISLYGDEKGFYPVGFRQGSGSIEDNDWSFQITGYLTEYRGLDYTSNADLRSKMLECPSMTIPSSATNVYNTYGIHARLLGKDPGFPFSGSPYLPRKFPWINRAGELILLADSDQEIDGESNPGMTRPLPDMMQDYNPATAEDLIPYGDNLDGPYGSPKEEIRYRHNWNTTANIVFVDGHLENVKIGTLKEKNIKFLENE